MQGSFLWLGLLLQWLHAAEASPLRTLTKRQEALSSIPDYVLTHAPYLYLSSQEEWWPTDVATFLPYTIPETGSQPATASPTFATLDTLSAQTYLTTSDDVTRDTDWVKNALGMPNATGYSSAPAYIIVAPKEGGIVDAFYFTFYAYNAGPDVLEESFGNHLGDWEHAMIRFMNGEPETVYLSQHDSGTAYSYSVLEQTEDRPTLCITNGDHAIYATSGEHHYDTLLSDNTNAGVFWDVTQNFNAYLFNATNGQFTAATTQNAVYQTDNIGLNEEAGEGVDWLTYIGYWGDQQYPKSDPRQFCLFGECRYVSGPNGPYLENLGRTAVCQDESNCVIQQSL